MTKICLLILTLFFGIAHAQQQPQFTMFNSTASIFNPALTGLEYRHFGAATYRHQWIGFGGEPRTTAWLYEFNARPLHGGLGTSGYFDQVGFETNLNLNLQYAYHITLSRKERLSIGLATGFNRKTFDADWVSISPNDPSIPTNGSSSAFNLNLGLAYHSRNLTVGLSSTQVTESTHTFGQAKVNSVRHYYLYSKYDLRVSKSSVIQPSTIIKTDFASTQFDISLKYILKNTYWAAVSYRHQDAICFMLGTDMLEKYRIACSYDHTLSPISNYSQGSVEFLLAIMLRKRIKRMLIMPRTPAF